MLPYLLLISTALAGSKTDGPIAACVQTFAAAAQTRDVEALRRVLDPAAVQQVFLKDAWSPLPTPTYLDLMSKGAIGGEPVNLDIQEVDQRGRVATVSAVRTTPTYRFEDTLTLIDHQGTWRIVGAAVVVSPVNP